MSIYNGSETINKVGSRKFEDGHLEGFVSVVNQLKGQFVMSQKINNKEIESLNLKLEYYFERLNNRNNEIDEKLNSIIHLMSNRPGQSLEEAASEVGQGIYRGAIGKAYDNPIEAAGIPKKFPLGNSDTNRYDINTRWDNKGQSKERPEESTRYGSGATEERSEFSNDKYHDMCFSAASVNDITSVSSYPMTSTGGGLNLGTAHSGSEWAFKPENSSLSVLPRKTQRSDSYYHREGPPFKIRDKEPDYKKVDPVASNNVNFEGSNNSPFLIAVNHAIRNDASSRNKENMGYEEDKHIRQVQESTSFPCHDMNTIQTQKGLVTNGHFSNDNLPIESPACDQVKSYAHDMGEQPEGFLSKESTVANGSQTNGCNTGTPQYKLEKNLKNVQEIWQEYEYGINGKPPLKDLEKQYSCKWRDEAELRTFLRRKKIYSAVEKGIKNGYDEDYILRELEKIRSFEQFGALKKKPLLWLYSNIPSKFT